jgi:hypothetical protein
MAEMDCTQNTDPLKLVREGTSQEQRTSRALDPAYAPVNERLPEHSIVFAQAYARYLRYYNSNNVASGDWQKFFSEDVSVQLATAAVQDVDQYKIRVKEYFNFLNNLENKDNELGLKESLGYLFSFVATLAKQLDVLKETLPKQILPDDAPTGTLPTEMPIKGVLQNLIKSQLAPSFGRMIGYYNAGLNLLVDSILTPVLVDGVPTPELRVLGSPILSFGSVIQAGLSDSWALNVGATDASVYGTPATLFEAVNHMATHNLFTSIFDQFLKAYARVVVDAKAALADTFTNWDNHEPHYALFLAFLRLQEHSRQETNTITKRHLDFYYRDILRLREKPAEPAHAHLLLELARQVDMYELPEGELVKAGKDDLGKDAFFATDRDFVANKAQVTALKTVYRHDNEPVINPTLPVSDDTGRLYASPVANSDDGLGAKLLSADQSWHPFFNKIYENDELREIRMPKAEVGFAVASHYLWLAEGYRRVTLTFQLTEKVTVNALVTVHLTTDKGWFSLDVPFTIADSQTATLPFALEADEPAILPYNPKLHGGDFQTEHPIVKVILRQQADHRYDYAALEGVVIESYTISVSVGLDASGTGIKPGLKTLAVSNNFGPVDTSKPFQPFGPIPQTNSTVLIGSKEVFQKAPVEIKLNLSWRGISGSAPTLSAAYYSKADWTLLINSISLSTSPIVLDIPASGSAAIDYTPNDSFATTTVGGFLKLYTNGDFGHKSWQSALLTHFEKIAKQEASTLPTAPDTPEIETISLSYSATSDPIPLNSSKNVASKGAKFYHLAPFGLAEQHPSLTTTKQVYLLPQVDVQDDGAELYIGITDLKAPQNLALLFQVADGTADPQAEKQHLAWSYLRDNEWVAFSKDQIEDTTGELLRSGIVTFAVPRDATAANTLLPGGMHWIRAAVVQKSEAICRLISVAAQALRLTFVDQGNDPAFPAKVLPAGTITKLDQPDAAVKKVTQPFATFGGRGQEDANAFYTRVSERLRHKDRALPFGIMNVWCWKRFRRFIK